MYDSLPNDPVILLSYINTKLRDEYSSFQEFCKAHNVSESDIEEKLGKIGYTYNQNQNQFK